MIDTYKKLSPYLGEITIMLNNNLISIQNHGKIISYTYDELLVHHGGHLPGGVALSFRMMQWLFDSVLKTTPEYGKFGFYTGLGKNGQGIIDTVAKVTGVQEPDSLRLDINYSLDKQGPIAPSGGRYYFEFDYKGKRYCIAITDNAIPEEFFRCSAEAHKKRSAGLELTEDELTHLQQLRIDLSKAILAADASDLFVLVDVKDI